MKNERRHTPIVRALRRFARVRLLFVLIALLLVPALALPFAERLRTEWARYWEPKVEEAANAEREGVRLADLALQAILADPSNRVPAVVSHSLSGDQSPVGG